MDHNVAFLAEPVPAAPVTPALFMDALEAALQLHPECARRALERSQAERREPRESRDGVWTSFIVTHVYSRVALLLGLHPQLEVQMHGSSSKEEIDCCLFPIDRCGSGTTRDAVVVLEHENHKSANEWKEKELARLLRLSNPLRVLVCYPEARDYPNVREIVAEALQPGTRPFVVVYRPFNQPHSVPVPFYRAEIWDGHTWSTRDIVLPVTT